MRKRLQQIREFVWKLEWDYVREGDGIGEPASTGMIQEVKRVPGGLHIVFNGLIPTFPAGETVGKGMSQTLKEAYLWPLVQQLKRLRFRIDDRSCAWFVHYFDRGPMVDVDNRITKWIVNAFVYARVLPDDSYKHLEIHASAYPCTDGFERTELYLLTVEEFTKQYLKTNQNKEINQPKTGEKNDVHSV